MKFFIGDILWLTVVVSLVVTCFLEREKRAAVAAAAKVNLAMLKEKIAIAENLEKRAEFLESESEYALLNREYRSLQHKLVETQANYRTALRDSELFRTQLKKEVVERLRLTREVERLTAASDNNSN
jgi:uncharacterized membrane protein YeiB